MLYLLIFGLTAQFHLLIWDMYMILKKLVRNFTISCFVGVERNNRKWVTNQTGKRYKKTTEHDLFIRKEENIIWFDQAAFNIKDGKLWKHRKNCLLKHPNDLVSQLSSNGGTGRQFLQTGRTVLPSAWTSSAREAPQVHCDPVNLPLALSNKDGAVRWAARHDPWGNIEEEFNADPEHIE